MAGYSFYYAGNSEYWSMMEPGYEPYKDDAQPCAEGLKQILNKNVACNYSDGHWARRGYNFDASPSGRGAFSKMTGAYQSLQDYYEAGRPIPSAGLPWNLIGYVDANDTRDPVITGSIAMECPVPGLLAGSESGVFVHSGLSPEADDWEKGYVSAALAIEEARAYLKPAIYLFDAQFGGDHVFDAAFSISSLAGAWGQCTADFPETEEQTFWYVDLMLTALDHFTPYGNIDKYSLSVADFQLFSPDTNMYATIILDQSGWQTGNQPGGNLLNSVGWWFLGLVLGKLCPPAAFTVSALHTIEKKPSPPTLNPAGRADGSVYANGTSVDPNGDEWGLVAMYFRVCVPVSASSGLHSFSLVLASWLQRVYIGGTDTTSVSLRLTDDMQFSFGM